MGSTTLLSFPDKIKIVSARVLKWHLSQLWHSIVAHKIAEPFLFHLTNNKFLAYKYNFVNNVYNSCKVQHAINYNICCN